MSPESTSQTRVPERGLVIFRLLYESIWVALEQAISLGYKSNLFAAPLLWSAHFSG